MKKTIALILSLLLVFGCAAAAVSAVSVDANGAEDQTDVQDASESGEPDGVVSEEKEYLYREIFKKHFNFVEFNGHNSSLQTIGKYEELYYHKDKDDMIDWVLIEVRARLQKPVVVFSVIGNRVFDYEDWQYPFASGYCVYDVVNDEFSDASDADNEKFPGFSRAVDEAVKKSPYNNRGRLIGDMDGDDELTMIDATLIQRCDIRIRDWPVDDLIKPEGHTYKKPPTYYSDFDLNGERDIVDATKLQRYVTMID